MHLHFEQLVHCVLSGACGQGIHYLVAVLVDHLTNKVIITLTGKCHFLWQYSDSYVMHMSIIVTYYATHLVGSEGCLYKNTESSNNSAKVTLFRLHAMHHVQFAIFQEINILYFLSFFLEFRLFH
jgi:hypothetical protein